MPWKFNPFSGTLDQTGSGGGGASYIDGEVATYAGLPLDGSAALNSAWLVRSSSGIWPFNKPAGIYYRSGTLGVSRDADYTFGGTLGDVFSDSVFLLYDEANTTRTGQFNLGSITAGQNRVLTWPDASGRIQVEGQPIGNTTPAAGSFTTLTASDGTRTATLAETSLNLQAGAGFNNVGILSLTNVANSVSLYVGNLQILSAQSTPAISLVRDCSLRWRASTTGPFSGTDVELTPQGANVLAQLNAANAQTFRLYNTFTSATNFERLAIGWASNVVSIKPEAGGAGGTVRELHISGLPTANPGPGILWNDGGTVKVGT